jgi:hypothetical protein
MSNFAESPTQKCNWCNEETMMVDTSKISEDDMTQAKAFIAAIPEATDANFNITDFRVKGVDFVTKKSENAVALEKILAQQKAAPTPIPTPEAASAPAKKSRAKK